MTKKTISALFAALSICGSISAQDTVGPSGYTIVDSIVYRPADTVDKTLEGKSIFTELQGVTLEQKESVAAGMSSHIALNRSKPLAGYRVRIFFDNKQDSRGASETALRRFQESFPGISAYRSFVNPFFKVTIGDFRTRSEATKMLQSVRGMFPSAFVVREQIKYPVVDREHGFICDTVKILKSIGGDSILN